MLNRILSANSLIHRPTVDSILSKFILPLRILENWQKHLEKENQIAAGISYFEYDFRRYSEILSWHLLAQINNKNIQTRCEICSKLTLKTPERRLAWF